MRARLNGWSHRSGRKAERFEKESASSKRQRRKRSDDSNQAIRAAVPRALERSVVSGETVGMDRANYRNEQRDSAASRLPFAKHEHVAHEDDHRQQTIFRGPGRPAIVPA